MVTQCFEDRGASQSLPPPVHDFLTTPRFLADVVCVLSVSLILCTPSLLVVPCDTHCAPVTVFTTSALVDDAPASVSQPLTQHSSAWTWRDGRQTTNTIHAICGPLDIPFHLPFISLPPLCQFVCLSLLYCSSSLGPSLGPEPSSQPGFPPAGSFPPCHLPLTNWGSEPLSLDRPCSQEWLRTQGPSPALRVPQPSPPCPSARPSAPHSPFGAFLLFSQSFPEVFAQNSILKVFFSFSIPPPSSPPALSRAQPCCPERLLGQREEMGVGGTELMLGFSFNKLVISYRLPWASVPHL